MPVLAIANGKGGVGKTTLAANIAGLAAASGWSVLAVDLDRQANLAADLGYGGDEAADNGRALYRALINGAPLVPSGREIRPGLDVVAGGTRTAQAIEDLGAIGDLATALRPLTRDYHLVVLDCPPAHERTIDEALLAADGLLVPVRCDAASLQGLELMAGQYQQAKQSNPGLRLVGVVMVGVSRSATAIRREVRETLEAALEGIAPVLDSAIGYAERAAYDMRLAGQLAHEYEAAAEDARRQRLRSLRNESGDLRLTRRFSTAATGLAADFEAVADEVLERLVAPNPGSPQVDSDESRSRVQP